MKSDVKYLFSGITAPNTGIMQVIGADRFSFQVQGVGTGAYVATGQILLQARVESAAPFVTIFSNTFANNSGMLFNYEYPVDSVRAILNDSPVPVGAFTAILRHSAINIG